MVDLSAVDLDELATALGDQGYFERRWLIDPASGEISLWTEDGGIDGEHPVDLGTGRRLAVVQRLLLAAGLRATSLPPPNRRARGGTISCRPSRWSPSVPAVAAIRVVDVLGGRGHAAP